MLRDVNFQLLLVVKFYLDNYTKLGILIIFIWLMI